MLSLLDQIPEEAPAGPWTTAAFARERGRLVGTAPGEGRLAYCAGLRLTGGAALLARAAYERPWGDGHVAELAVRRGDAVVATREAPLGRSWQEFRLAIPPGGADALELRCRVPPGTEAPTLSLVAVTMEPGVSPTEWRRASSLLAWAARQSAYLTPTLLRWRRFHLTLEAGSSEIVAIAAGDTLWFDVPRAFRGGTLEFEPISLRSGTGPDAAVVLDACTGGRWVSVAAWGLSSGPAGRARRETAPLPRDADRLRLSLAGRDELVGIGTPLVFPRRAHRRGTNLLLIVLDTLRADRLGCYGYLARSTSGALDSLLNARGFAIFHRAYSGAPTTMSSTPKFLASRYLNIHQAEHISRGNMTLAEMLRRSGYYCAAFTGGGVLQCPGFDQGFHEYHTSKRLGKVEEVFEPAGLWLAEHARRPFFLLVHTYETHTPYTRDIFCASLPHGRLGDISKGERLMSPTVGAQGAGDAAMVLSSEESLYVEAAYDGGVRVAADATVDLLAALDRNDGWENTVVVVLSDHGEEFWEHTGSYAQHPGESVYNELLHVPFLVREPGARNGKARHVHEIASTVDLVPTVLELLGLPPPGPLDGTSLVAALKGAQVRRSIPVMAMNDPQEGSPRACVFTDSLKYCAADSPKRGEEIYDLRADPRELRNLANERANRARELSLLLDQGLQAAASPVSREGQMPDALPEGLREQLELLGYVAPARRRGERG